MKITIRFISLLSFAFLLNLTAQAQGSICGATVPIPFCPDDTLLCTFEMSDPIDLSTSSSLPDLEFAIVDLNQLATNNSGPAIIAIDLNGQFIPVDIGVDSNTMLEVFPIAYDLAAIQETLDDVLTGTIPPFNIPCCTLAPDACTELNDAGIYSGSDFTSLSQAFSLLTADTNALFSINDFVDGLDSINLALSNPLIPAACGGGDVICYAYGTTCPFTVILLDALANLAPPLHMTDALVLADSIHSSATVLGGLSVDYLFVHEAILIPGFEVLFNGSFTAEPGGCD